MLCEVALSHTSCFLFLDAAPLLPPYLTFQKKFSDVLQNDSVTFAVYSYHGATPSDMPYMEAEIRVCEHQYFDFFVCVCVLCMYMSMCLNL